MNKMEKDYKQPPDHHVILNWYNPTVFDLLKEAMNLCEELKKPVDFKKIRVTTDFGTKVVLYYENKNE